MLRIPTIFLTLCQEAGTGLLTGLGLAFLGSFSPGESGSGLIGEEPGVPVEPPEASPTLLSEIDSESEIYSCWSNKGIIARFSSEHGFLQPEHGFESTGLTMDKVEEPIMRDLAGQIETGGLPFNTVDNIFTINVGGYEPQYQAAYIPEGVFVPSYWIK